ncbi:MAG: hypothetical protein LAT79_18360 [Kiritimatiellae bacterium]|nr:hypothetical protein [Kiritimatiellia bacterium]
MKNNDNLSWERGSSDILWNGVPLSAPGKVLWVSELPERNGLAIVTLFDELTPKCEPNGFVYIPNEEIKICTVKENDRLVRFLGCYTEEGKLVFNAANEMEYVYDPDNLDVINIRYYR